MGRYKRALFLFRIAKTLFISPFNSIIYLNKNVQMLKHFVQIFKLNNDMFKFSWHVNFRCVLKTSIVAKIRLVEKVDSQVEDLVEKVENLVE